MTATMTRPGPITPTGNDWSERLERAEKNRLRSWEGFKVDHISGLNPLEVDALERTGQVAA